MPTITIGGEILPAIECQRCQTRALIYPPEALDAHNARYHGEAVKVQRIRWRPGAKAKPMIDPIAAMIE